MIAGDEASKGLALVLLGCIAEIPSDIAQYGALGILALYFLVVSPRIEAAREKNRQQQFDALMRLVAKRSKHEGEE